MLEVTIIGLWYLKKRVTIARHKRFKTIMIDSALASVDAEVVSSPKVLRVSISVVPPRIGNAVDFKWRANAIVLYWNSLVITLYYSKIFLLDNYLVTLID